MDPEYFAKWEAEQQERREKLRTSEGRYYDRIKQQVNAHNYYKLLKHVYPDYKGTAPKIRHHIFWVLHNCAAHPLLGVFPNKYLVDIHHLTSEWLNNERNSKSEQIPVIKNRLWWLLHNCVAHPMIGLLPVKLLFQFHDWTAEKMNVEGWV